ncbi:HAD-IA family hydrolase [Roseibacterium beibuensis]|uniref:phosphoglycolate phosphatase n=1 Tax=[Roseibacterium] beibuensis TaxID=1193142 RepID=A0ABP9L4W5_9RHOB|nr:HAD-IA family hydrolase [Roseibacterium beibuensis]MCS6623851.1 HAD-IA family hydrolase [Roseibacterium beibuensis]
MTRTVIFDLDGTLADTSGDLIAAANMALSEMGFAPQLNRGQDDATAFRGGRAMLRLAAERMALAEAEAMIERGYPLLLDAYGRDIDRHTSLYPGAMAAVGRLRAAGVAVGICTNKPEGLAIQLLDRLGISDQFASLIGADTLPTRKPDAAPYRAAVDAAGGALERSFLVGDTETDRKTARAAGVPCALVTFGPTGRAVAELEPEALVDHFDAFDTVVAQLLP